MIEEPQRSAASEFALALLTGLLARGVRHLVLAPGSRSQALALAATRLARDGALDVFVRVDERVAGFTALGLARETGMPVAVVCTSGTAAANLLPAAMEAFHAGVPLLLLTADRPPELRGVGANQTTKQDGLFVSFVRQSVDVAVPGDGPLDGGSIAAGAVAASLGLDDGSGVRGPVHLNLPMREPLSGTLPERIEIALGEAPHPPAADVFDVVGSARTVVVAGADAGTSAAELARAGGWPLIAEIVSGARFGANVVPDYRARLRDDALGGRVERVVVFGHPTLSREVTALLSSPEIDVIAVRQTGDALNLNAKTREVAAVRTTGIQGDSSWLNDWTAPARNATPCGEELDRETLVAEVWSATTPDDRLMFGSSRLVRVADQVLDGGTQRVHSNRGLAGIDGTVATATGIALAAQKSNPASVTRVLLGDLALLHDVGAMMLPADEPPVRMQVIVGNDGGGTIFDALEVAGSAPAEDLDRAFYTPQAVRLADLAAAYGWQHSLVKSREQLAEALAASVAGPQLIEIPLCR